jgi:2-hydroxy-3-oxopropionate reductase
MELLKIGIVGLGVMGGGICQRLLGCKIPVTGLDASPARMALFSDKGVVPASTPAEVAESSDFVILSLNHSDIVEEVVFGSGGIVDTAAEGKMIIDMSSIDPARTRQMADRLRQQTSMAWVDAPLSGGVPAVAEGKLAVFGGGSPEDFEKSHQVMDHLASNYTHMGPQGAGQTTKLINQVFCACNFAVVAEATWLALKGGVAAERIPAALAGGRADSRILQEYMAKIATRDLAPTGRLDNMLKDLRMVQSFADEAGAAMPITGLVTEMHRQLCANGWGETDNAAILIFFEGVVNDSAKIE